MGCSAKLDFLDIRANRAADRAAVRAADRAAERATDLPKTF